MKLQEVSGSARAHCGPVGTWATLWPDRVVFLEGLSMQVFRVKPPPFSAC